LAILSSFIFQNRLKLPRFSHKYEFQQFTNPTISVVLVLEPWSSLPPYQPYQHLSTFLQQFNTRKSFEESSEIFSYKFIIIKQFKTLLKLQHHYLKVSIIPIRTLMLLLTPKERAPENNLLILY